MTAKNAPKSTSKSRTKKAKVTKRGAMDKAMSEARALSLLRPVFQAGLSLRDINKHVGKIDMTVLLDELVSRCETVNNGNFSEGEKMLVAQAYTLDSLFHSLVRKAEQAEFLNQVEVSLRLALKAQAQCRATWEALAVIKNPPPVAFVRQANIAHGPQQINNGVFTDQSGACSRSEKSKNQPNKVLETQHGERLESGASGKTGNADLSLEAVG